MWYWWA